MTNPRHALAAARIVLRAAEDHEKTIKAILTMSVAGTNEQQRKGNAAILLQGDDEYQDSLRDLRAAEAALDHAAADVAIYEDDLRRAELAAREKLAEALMGKRVDNAILDGMPYIPLTSDEERQIENYAKGFDIP